MPAENHLQQLNDLILAVRKTNAFYHDRLPDQPVRSLAEFARQVPLTTKQDIVADQLQHPPYGSNLTFPLSDYTRYHQTSGTTGTPIRWLDTPESWGWMVENWCDVYRAAGVEAGDRCFFAFSFGPFLGFWTAFEAAERLHCLCIPGGGMRSSARLAAIMDNAVTVLCCTPTYAIHLGQVAAKECIDLSGSSVRRILVAGEPGGSIPSTRREIERLWPGAVVVDHHGMTEIGPASYQCPADPSCLHLIDRSFYAEIVDDSGNAVSRGGPGELILTNLGRIGSPLIRYRTGDLVRQYTESCGCGRADTGLIGGILGRLDDMVIVRGVNIYPAAIEDVVRRFDQLAEYRVTIAGASGLSEISLEIEPATRCENADILSHAIAEALYATFNLRIPVTSVPTDSLPRFELKASRWVRA